MPVIQSFIKPKNRKELNEKILKSEPRKEYLIPDDVKSHVSSI